MSSDNTALSRRVLGAGWAWLGLAGLLGMGCIGAKSVPCGDAVCLPKEDCDPVHLICVHPSQLTSCLGRADGEQCQVGSETGYHCHLEVCIPGQCGDGSVDADEECDEGPANSDTIPDACRSNCRVAACGDGVVDAGEECDAGPANSDTTPDACRATCRRAGCGDEIIDTGERCDDGNQVGGDGCSADCRSDEQCGTGVIDVPLGESCDDGNVVPWDGCTDCAITEFQVNSVIAGSQNRSVVGFAQDGRFVVAWQGGINQDGDGVGIFGQRYDGAGRPLGAEFQANTFTTGEQAEPDVAVAADGSFVVVWEDWAQDGDLQGVYAQRFDGAGGAVGGEFRVNTYVTGWQRYPRVAGAPDGRFVVVWNSLAQDGAGDGVFGQLYDGAGPVGNEFSVNTSTAGNQHAQAVAMDHLGRFVVVWVDDNGLDGDGEGVFGQRFDAFGGKLGAEFPVNTTTTGSQRAPAVAAHPGGGFVVAFDVAPGPSTNADGVRAQRYDSAGAPLGAEISVYSLVGGGSAGGPAVATTPKGGFVVAFEVPAQVGSFVHNVAARWYDDQGAPVGAEAVVNRSTTDSRLAADVAVSPGGVTAFTWTASGDLDGLGEGVFALLLDPTGEALAPGGTCASAPCRESDCTDGADEDGDGLSDCADWDCNASPVCQAACSDVDIGSATGMAVVSESNVGAGDDVPSSPRCGSATSSGEDRAFRWRAASDGCYRIDTEGSSYDTVLRIFSGCLSGQVACDDDGGAGSTSTIVRPFLAGESVILVVDGFSSSSSGSLQLNISGLGAVCP